MPGKIRDIYGSMVSSGQYAMQGLANGIDSGSGSAIARAQAVASQIKSTINRALDIHSPSRVMERETGVWIPSGIAVGIDKNRGVIDKALYKVKEGIANYDLSSDNLLTRARARFEMGSNAFISKQAFKMELAHGGYTVEVPVNVNNREIARGVAPIVRDENNRVERLERYKKGER